MKNNKALSPRNEGVTIMMSFEEKSDYIRFCEEREIALSEMGRLALKEMMSNVTSSNEKKLSLEIMKNEAEFYEYLLRKYMERHSVASKNIKVLKEFLRSKNISIPEGLLGKFNGSEYDKSNHKPSFGNKK
jgi:hypothetical protein